jgi:hypothetical protein
MWLVLLSLKTRRLANQRELAEVVGVKEATLTGASPATSAPARAARAPGPGSSRATHEMLVFLTGRKTGKAYRRPVGYLRDGSSNSHLSAGTSTTPPSRGLDFTAASLDNGGR